MSKQPKQTAARLKRIKSQPRVNTVTVNDLLEVLEAGLRDFKAAPIYGLFFSGIYVLGGWLLILLLLYFELPYLVYPLAAGFALIAPFIASSFYVVSKCLEDDKSVLSWGLVFGAVKIQFSRDLGWMALVTGFSLFIWMDIAAFLTFGFMGFQLFNTTELIETVFNTPKGLAFLVVGNITGAIIAFGVFSFSVISIPMLYHRDIDFITAMITSVRFVKHNPKTMIVWCTVIAALVMISMLSALIGLFVTLPILGHSTWHLYRRAIEDN